MSTASAKVSKTRMLVIAAVCIALAFVLNQVSLFRMPMGGSVTPFSMMFIVLAGYWLGPVYGILAGVAMGLLNSATGAYIVHPMQYLLDYIFGFGALGLSGLFRKFNYGLQIGYIAGVLGRFIMVFLSGYIFFYMWAPEGQHAAVYSMLYNIAYIGPEAVASLFLISMPSMKHAVDRVTKNIVSPADYALMKKAQKPLTLTARLVSGSGVAALGALSFVIAAHIQRLENLSVTHYTTGVAILAEAPTRLYRMIERNTEQIIWLQAVGAVFLAISAGLLFSALASAKDTD